MSVKQRNRGRKIAEFRQAPEGISQEWQNSQPDEPVAGESAQGVVAEEITDISGFDATACADTSDASVASFENIDAAIFFDLEEEAPKETREAADYLEKLKETPSVENIASPVEGRAEKSRVDIPPKPDMENIQDRSLPKEQKDDVSAHNEQLPSTVFSGSCIGRVTKIVKPLCHLNYMMFAAAGLIIIMLCAACGYVWKQAQVAKNLLETGPSEAYALEKAGHHDDARRLWAQINSKAGWYMPFAGIGTNINQPYLQKASLAYRAEAWDDVAENAYKALNVPITDQQAMYVQQMILTATANKVRAYLPNQAEQPIRGGIPDHEPPVCNPSSAWIWSIPAMLFIVAMLCLYGKMRLLFAASALMMPLWFWGATVWNESATKDCEARLSFNPSHIELYAMASQIGQTGPGFKEVTGSSFDKLTQIPKGNVVSVAPTESPAKLGGSEISLPNPGGVQ